MQAWHFTGTNEPLVQVELPDPVAGQGEVVIDVKAAGLCHSPTTAFGAPGFVTDGGFGEKARCAATALVRISDGVSFGLGAAGTDAGMTSHAAVIGKGEVKAGDKVRIIGFGGLGQIGARVAVLAGAEIYVAEINESVWDNAKAVGAKGAASVGGSSRSGWAGSRRRSRRSGSSSSP